MCNFQFRERSQTFLGNFPAFIARNLKKTKEHFFWTTLFSSKCSFELIEQKFGILADFFVENLKVFRSNSEIH